MTSVQAYRLLALSPIDPLPESWRWQRAGHLVNVLLRKIALRGVPPYPLPESVLRKQAAWIARMRAHGSRSA